MTSADDFQAISSALSTGDLPEAERRCRDALADDPRNVDVLLMLAVSLHWQKRLDEAVAIYARLTGLQPRSALHWSNYATALREQADKTASPAAGLDASAEAYRTALRLEPGNVAALVNYGLLLLQRRDFLGARDALLKAVKLDPATPRTRIHAARACLECHDSGASELLLPWRQWSALDPVLQRELASLLAAQGDGADAMTVLESLLREQPHDVPARLQLAGLLEHTNQLDRAEKMLQDMADAPEVDAAVRNEVAHQRATLAMRRSDPAAARQLLEQAGPRGEGDYAHDFTLASACDKLDDRAATWQALERAHATQIEAMKLAVPYRFVDDAPILPAAVDRVGAEQFADWPELPAPGMRESPVFVVGFPRSGTTLVEQMLDAHPRLQSMDERPFLNILGDSLSARGLRVPLDLQRLNADDCERLRAHYWRLVADRVTLDEGGQLVDKNPLNMLSLPLIKRLFPHAKIILTVRDPRDVILSCYMQHFHSSVLAVAAASIEKLARTYVVAMQHWLHHVEVLQPDVRVVRYESLVADIDAQARVIADFLGLDDATCMAAFDRHARDKGYIATPSYTQVIQPVNRKAVGRWQRYREHMEPALSILAPMLQHWGYPGDPTRHADSKPQL